jgi:glycosyltransferase involved in cell wall biosynthesis
MRVLLLAEPRAPHTIKWAKSLAEAGIEISLVGLSGWPAGIYEGQRNLSVQSLGFDLSLVATDSAKVSKLRYLTMYRRVMRFVRKFSPDIVHAHYASSYGLFGALTGFHPLLVSVWGCDVYDFPKQSRIHEAVLRWNLSRADAVLSTSEVMARETAKYTGKKIVVTPFGVDVEKFKPAERIGERPIVIGTVKTLEAKYGIEYLLRAFAELKRRMPTVPLKLLLVGGGSRANLLLNLAHELRINEDTTFAGPVPFEKVLDYHRQLDIAVFPSIADSESFGVAVVEANACGVPVVVSSVGGLSEVVQDGVTGIVVPPCNATAIADALELFVTNPELRRRVGEAGRKRVIERYNWRDNVRQMIDLYEEYAGAGVSNAACVPVAKRPEVSNL